jgi:hypothetical protein
MDEQIKALFDEICAPILDTNWREQIDPELKKQVDKRLDESNLDEDERPIVEDWIWRAIFNKDLTDLFLSKFLKIKGVKPVMEICEEGTFCKDIIPNFKQA